MGGKSCMRTILGEPIGEDLYKNYHRGANRGKNYMRTIMGVTIGGKELY